MTSAEKAAEHVAQAEDLIRLRKRNTGLAVVHATLALYYERDAGRQ